MKKFLIILIAVLFGNLPTNGQNLFLIGEKSYPCTSAITLESNSNDGYDLDVFLGKDGKSGIFAVSIRSKLDERINGKLIIYLEDGNVLICNESEATENVDNDTKALYNLTADQLIKLKSSNIHTVKYTTTFYGGQNNYSASNTGIETKALISEFFNQSEKSIDNVKLSDSLKITNLLEASEVEPLTTPEQMPTFPNGEEAMNKYIFDMLRYPELARRNGISGDVIVQFVVSTDGEIQQAKVVRGIGGGCNEEALRIVNKMPKWNPGKNKGHTVSVLTSLPIKFILL